jgi:hypothetical protein
MKIRLSKKQWETIGKETGWLKTSVKQILQNVEFLKPQDYYFNVSESYTSPFGFGIYIDFIVKSTYDSEGDIDKPELSQKEKNMFLMIKRNLSKNLGYKVNTAYSTSEFPWDIGFMYSGSDKLSDEEADNISFAEDEKNPLVTPDEQAKAERIRQQAIASLKSQGFYYLQSLDVGP